MAIAIPATLVMPPLRGSKFSLDCHNLTLDQLKSAGFIVTNLLLMMAKQILKIDAVFL